MPHEIVTVPCLADNYAFLIHDSATGGTALVDAPEAAPIEAALGARGWTLTDILITHHHDDHVQGLGPLRGGVRVVGAAADAHRLPPLDLEVAPGDPLNVAGEVATVIDTPGHTVGHVAFHFPGLGAVFTGDGLMALGCGRLFEGTAAQMWDTMRRLRALPHDTVVYSGHEYTAANAAFALTLEPDNPDLISRASATDAARAAGQPTVPSTLGEELRTNPYLRVDDPAFLSATGLTGAPADVLAEVRRRKDAF